MKDDNVALDGDSSITVVSRGNPDVGMTCRAVRVREPLSRSLTSTRHSYERKHDSFFIPLIDGLRPGVQKIVRGYRARVRVTRNAVR